MPRLPRPDGAEIHWEQRGDGPLVALASYWSGHPEVYSGLLSELARDHRVLTYHARGTGESTRAGPYDAPTDCGDLAALLAEAGGSAIVLAVADATNRAGRLATERPDLAAKVIAVGTPPFKRENFAGGEGMIGSDSVVEAFLTMVERDYRGALRTLLAATNPQMTEEERSDRVQFQTQFCEPEAASGRLQAWLNDDPVESAKGLGDRLWVMWASNVAGPWLPPGEKVSDLIPRLFPEA